MDQVANQKSKPLSKGCVIAAAVPAGICGLLTLICIISSFIPTNPIKLASSMAQVDIPKGATVLTNDDTGPSLPIPGNASDGYTFLIVQIPPKRMLEFSLALADSDVWKSLPLPQEFIDNEWLLQPDNGTIPLDTPTGYYLFVDWQEEYNKTHSEKSNDTTEPFYERDNFNFTFGLYDDKTGMLYLWSLDT